MIIVEKIEVWGFKHSIRGMRNPKNSWSKSDSVFYDLHDDWSIGEKDLALMKNLVKAGQEHRKFMRQIFVSMDITAPRYWWAEFDTYKVGTAANSCSTMHKLCSKPVSIVDFSFDYQGAEELALVDRLEKLRIKYNETKDKSYWRRLIQNLPQSYNQRRTVTLNYEVIFQMYKQRRDHKLQEWHDFCNVLASLPYAKELIIEPIKEMEKNL